MPDFEQTEVDHHLEVVDRKSTTFRSDHRYLIKCKSPSRFFIREYNWTGSGSEKEHVPEVISEIDVWGFPKHRIHGPLLAEDRFRILVVDLGRTISVGEMETVLFKHKMKDLNGTFKNFLGVRPRDKIKKFIKLSLDLPNWDGLQVNYHVYAHDTGRIMNTVKTEPTTVENGRALFEKVINKPHERNMGHKLEWTHKEV